MIKKHRAVLLAIVSLALIFTIKCLADTVAQWLAAGIPASNAPLVATAGKILVADGTRYVECSMSSGATIASGGAVTLKSGAATNLQVLTADGAGGTSWTTPSSGGFSAILYGDGSDGSLTFDGVANPVAGATLSANTYTMTRDIYASSISISTGKTVFTDGYRIFCSGTMTFNGSAVVENNGADANSGTAPGVATGNGTFGKATSGGGGNVNANGSNGTNGTQVFGAIGGAGGNNGGANAGGAAGTVTALGAASGGSGLQHNIFSMTTIMTGLGGGWNGGTGGGGGGGAIGLHGGSGGAGGGALFVAVKTLVASGTSGTQFQAKGGQGCAGDGNNTGGGGGGGGGFMIISTSASLPAGIATSVAGGAKGTGTGAGNNGVDGTTGTALVIVNQ